jgi:Tn3 transposase DDE domain
MPCGSAETVSVLPEVVEAIGGELSVEGGVLDILVSEVVLDGAGVLAVVGKFEAGRMAHHLLGRVAGASEKLTERSGGHLPAIANENANIDQIVATLGPKEMTQGTLIRKLCTYTRPNPTRRAIFEFDKLVRSIYTLRYLRNPQLQRDVQRSQNRLESDHQLRAAIAQVGGKKELTGKTDIEIEISNQCARLIANAIIDYNSAILSRLLAKYGTSPSVKALAMIKKVSPAARRHIHLNGRYTFRDSGQVIDPNAIVAGLNLT